MTLYKLTSQENLTRDDTLWGNNVTHTPTDKYKGKYLPPLCSPYWIHAYNNPFVAVLFNCEHANIKKPKLWLAKGKIEQTDADGKNGVYLKVGTTKLTTIKEIPLPEITTKQFRKFVLLCCVQIIKTNYNNNIPELWKPFIQWTKNWTSGIDNSKYSQFWISPYSQFWISGIDCLSYVDNSKYVDKFLYENNSICSVISSLNTLTLTNKQSVNNILTAVRLTDKQSNQQEIIYTLIHILTNTINFTNLQFNKIIKESFSTLTPL